MYRDGTTDMLHLLVVLLLDDGHSEAGHQSYDQGSANKNTSPFLSRLSVGTERSGTTFQRFVVFHPDPLGQRKENVLCTAGVPKKT